MINMNRIQAKQKLNLPLTRSEQRDIYIYNNIIKNKKRSKKNAFKL